MSRAGLRRTILAALLLVGPALSGATLAAVNLVATKTATDDNGGSPRPTPSSSPTPAPRRRPTS